MADDIIPERLTLARERRGMTKVALADAIEISRRSITAYEAGESNPSDETLEDLSAVLQFPKDFFTRPPVDVPDVKGVSFRALSTLTARDRDRGLAAAAIVTEINEWIEERFVLPSPALPDHPEDSEMPEASADALRLAWGLGHGPIDNMVHLLEAKGVRVFSLVEDCRSLDAFCFRRERTPYVMINTVKSAEHNRFDAAHELGHLLLHPVPGRHEPRRREREADQFAAALLMPRETIRQYADAASTASLDELIYLKRPWKVSLASWVRRLHDVGILSDWRYRQRFIELSRRGFRREEPEPGTREQSQLLSKVLTSLRDEGTPLSHLGAAVGLSLDEMRRYVFGLVLVPLGGSNSGGGPRPSLHVVGERS